MSEIADGDRRTCPNGHEILFRDQDSCPFCGAAVQRSEEPESSSPEPRPFGSKVVPPPANPATGSTTGSWGSQPATGSHVLVGSVLVSLCVIIMGTILALQQPETQAYQDGYGAGYEVGTTGGLSEDTACDPSDLTIAERAATPAQKDDWESGCHDGFADAQE